jgi:AAA ATPase domain
MTILLADVPLGPGDSPDRGGWGLLDETVAGVGGVVFERTVDLAHGNAGTTALAAFHIAADAATAAVRLVRTLPPAGAATRPGRRPVRIALCTGEVDPTDDGYRGSAVERALQLSALPIDATILVAASTAVMISHALPRGADLVDLGGLAVSEYRHERVHELRLPAGDGNGVPPDDAGASNLGWARRAAAGLVVGRDGPVELLEGAWERVRRGEHLMVVVSGDPGIGKTTVAAELALRLHATGALVLYGRWDEEALAPYQAIREALGTYAAASPKPLLRADVASHAEDLARLLPDLGARIGGVRAALVDDPDAERRRLFDAITHWLGAIARRHPVLLVLDDLQWAERSSLLLLRHVLDAPPDAPVLVVVTLRDGDVEGMGPLHTLGLFEAGEDVERLELSGLPPSAIERLVAQALGRPVDDEEARIARWMADETAGNPLFVQEILRGLDAADPGGSLRAVPEQLPERLHDVVRWRLDRLDPQVGDVLAAASIIGEEFGLDVLAASLDRPALDVRSSLDDAVHAGLVRDAADERLAFAHAVVRRTLQDALPTSHTAVLHRRIADVLVDRAGDGSSAPAIAHHYLNAANAHLAGRAASDTTPVAPEAATAAALAVRWGRAAADQARRETAFEGAVWFLGRVVDVHDRGAGDGVLACELRLELAEAHDRAGEFTARDRRHLEAAERARALDRTDLLTRAALGYGGRLPAATLPNPTARSLLQEALARLSPSDSRSRALALARLAHVVTLAAPHAERRAESDEAVAMARRLDAPVVLASVLVSRSLALDGPDDVQEQLELGEEVMAIGRQTGDPDLVLQGARARIQALFVVGRHAEAQILARELTALAHEVRHPDHLRIASMWATMWAVIEGRFDEAQARADALRDELRAAGHSQAQHMSVAQTLVLRLLHGGVEAMRPLVEAIRRPASPSLNGWALLTWLEAGSGNVARAEDLLDEEDPARLASQDRGYLWRPTVIGAAAAASLTGHRGWASAAHEALGPYAGQNAVMGYASFLGAVDHHLGTLDATLGRGEAAIDELEAGLERHRALGARPFVALSARWLANALVERAVPVDTDRALLLHAESLALEEELGLASLPAAHPKLGRD